ncbi:imelysin family protein [uncultured Sulfitobacter sp.]|uniref:imelysin family protein n=1 Tax=uncultured Sulfitobacter sp. TaxID=191468 RepID=UPI002633AEAF|nr:imelysin family protein [uncultured Sulfitobacter sp.]
MKRLLLSAALAIVAVPSHAQTRNEMITGIVVDHVLAGVDTLAAQTAKLDETARSDCDPASQTLRSRYSEAFDAWLAVSHLRFGPTEVGDRAFALAFWPDSRGATPRALASLMSAQDPVAQNADAYAQVSIAARGFYAMELLLFDETTTSGANHEYLCTLVRTVAADIANNSAAIAQNWQTDYAAALLEPAVQGVYRSDDEVLQELFKALATGLQFTSETRLGRPLGTYDRPRPARAEAWRSGRSARNVALSLEALRDLARHLSANDADLSARIEGRFNKAVIQLSDLKDPIFAGVSAPQTRLKVEVLQQSVGAIRALVTEELGPTLGVAAGFNALDGD